MFPNKCLLPLIGAALVALAGPASAQDYGAMLQQQIQAMNANIARGQQMVAAAELQGHRCSGCHLDLSPGEMDEVRDAAASNGGIADCPQCNRLLVVG